MQPEAQALKQHTGKKVRGSYKRTENCLTKVPFTGGLAYRPLREGERECCSLSLLAAYRKLPFILFDKIMH